MASILVSASDISLFHVAQVQLNDATQWWRIAALNALSDPDLSWLPGPIALALPALSEVAGVGLPGVAA